MPKGDRWQSFEDLSVTAQQRIILTELREDYSQLETTMERMSDENWRLREAAKRALVYILGVMAQSQDRTDAMAELRSALGYAGAQEAIDE